MADALHDAGRLMTSVPSSDPSGAAGEPSPADIEHPRGTLAIVAIFGLLFVLGWLAMYGLRFLERGATHQH